MTASPELPADVAAYFMTDTFSEATVPAALMKSHSTKLGVWALIHVREGQLAYRVTDPRRSPSDQVLTPGVPGVVEPTILHEVSPIGAVRFNVEFYRAPRAATKPA